MKKAVPALLSMALIATSTSAMAEGESVDLTVTGSVVPSACVLALGNGGEFDWGTIPSSSLNHPLINLLEKKHLQLTVACAAPTKFALRIVDNEADSASDLIPHSRGAGLINGKPIGGYGLRFTGGTIDGNRYGGSMKSEDNGETWTVYPGPTEAVSTTGWFAFAKNGWPEVAPHPIANLTVDLQAWAHVVGKDSLPIGEEDIKFKGSSTVEVLYL